MIKIKDDILLEIFYGEINLSEKYAKVSDDEKEILDQKNILEEELFSNFNEKQLDLYQKIFEIDSDYNTIRNENFFLEGVELGNKLSKRLEENT